MSLIDVDPTQVCTLFCSEIIRVFLNSHFNSQSTLPTRYSKFLRKLPSCVVRLSLCTFSPGETTKVKVSSPPTICFCVSPKGPLSHYHLTSTCSTDYVPVFPPQLPNWHEGPEGHLTNVAYVSQGTSHLQTIPVTNLYPRIVWRTLPLDSQRLIVTQNWVSFIVNTL